jgi:hypothetical protein
MAGTIYKVMKAKTVNGNDKKIWNQVGTVIIREGGKNGALFLHFLDGDFALFLKDDAEKQDGSEAKPAAEAQPSSQPRNGSRARRPNATPAPQ